MRGNDESHAIKPIIRKYLNNQAQNIVNIASSYISAHFVAMLLAETLSAKVYVPFE